MLTRDQIHKLSKDLISESEFRQLCDLAKKALDKGPNYKITHSEYPNIERRYREGETLAAIGHVYGVSRERIRQILRSRRVSADCGGMSVKSKQRENKRRAQRDQYWRNKYGISLKEREQILNLYGSEPFSRYRNQIKNAKTRGIPWKFTFRSWWKIWQDSGRWNQRGRKRGQYVMARLGDVGPYSPDNVVIQTVSENIQQGHLIKQIQAANFAPADVLQVEQTTGISRHDLRPDIFGPRKKTA